MTIAQLAQSTSLTKGFLSRVERDETSPSVATLVTICQVLSLPVGRLFESSGTELVRLEEAPLINMGGSGVVERLLTPRSEPRLQLLRSVLEPGATGGTVPYSVNCDVEAVHVLRGTVVLVLIEEEVTLREGDSLTMAGRELHTWHNRSEQKAELIWAIVPAAWSGSM